MTSYWVHRRICSLGGASLLMSVALLSASDLSPPPSAGAASNANDFTLVLRDRAGSYRYWQTLTQGRAYRLAIAAFGRPFRVRVLCSEKTDCRPTTGSFVRLEE